MHDWEKSDSAIVAVKPPNKAGLPVAEAVEPRAGTKGNADQQSTHRTQSRKRVTQALSRVRQAERFAVKHPRQEPDARIGLVRICAGCALKAHETMSPEMATAVKPSRQPRTESCVELGNGLCEA